VFAGHARQLAASGARVRREHVGGHAAALRRAAASRARGPSERRVVVAVRAERTVARRSARADRRGVFGRAVVSRRPVRTAVRDVPLAGKTDAFRSAAAVRTAAERRFRSTTCTAAAAAASYSSRPGPGPRVHKSAGTVAQTAADRRTIRAGAVHRRFRPSAVSGPAAFDRDTSRARAHSDHRKPKRHTAPVCSNSHTRSRSAKHIFHHTSVENVSAPHLLSST